MIHGLLFLLSLAGFALLLAAMSRHQQDWLRRTLPRRTSHCLRSSAFLLLGLALVFAALGFGWAYGAVVWCGWLSAGAGLVVTVNVNRDLVLRRISR